MAKTGKRLLYSLEGRPHEVALAPGDLAIDTHVHTEYSHDSGAKVEDVLAAAVRRGLSGIALTDHNSMEGYRRAEPLLARWKQEGKAPADFFLIPGEEVSTADGHVIALFVTAPLPPGLSAGETIDRIHAQHGLAIAAHPLFRESLGEQAKTLPFDGIERWNGAEQDLYAVAKAPARARRDAFYAGYEGLQLGASDAHVARMVGMSYTVLPDCRPTLEAVRAALEAGRAVPATAFRLGRRIRRLSHEASHVTWDDPVTLQGVWTCAPMFRIPWSRDTLYMKVNNGFGVALTKRF